MRLPFYSSKKPSVLIVQSTSLGKPKSNKMFITACFQFEQYHIRHEAILKEEERLAKNKT